MPSPVAFVLPHRGDNDGESITEVNGVIDDVHDDLTGRGWHYTRIGCPVINVEIDERTVLSVPLPHRIENRAARKTEISYDAAYDVRGHVNKAGKETKPVEGL